MKQNAQARAPFGGPSYLWLTIIFLTSVLAQAEIPTKMPEEIPPAWSKLLRYSSSGLWGSGIESEVDTEEFFLSPVGKENWQAEWKVSVDQLFRPLNPRELPDQHPRCRFPARTQFLESYLDTKAMLEQSACHKLQQLKLKIGLQKVFLVYAGQYVARPASAFGHTFFRLQSKDNPSANPHLDYGLDFAAQVTTNNPFLYGVMGIVGGFWGRFGLMPYTNKLGQYNSLDRRDLWEYEIPLNEQQLDFFVAHLFEMEWAGFDYFYFSENCSYHILRFLEAVDENRFLSHMLHPIVIPADTIQVLANQYNFPSLQWRAGAQISFENSYRQLSAQEKVNFNHWQKKSWTSPSHQLNSFHELKTALLYLDAQFAEDMAANPQSDVAKHKLALATQLSELRLSKAHLPAPATNADSSLRKYPPHQSMPSRRLSLGLKSSHAGKENFTLINYRWALSSWDEWERARLQHTTLEMGDLRISLDHKNERLYLQRFYLLNLINRVPLNLFAPTPSYGLTLGAHDPSWTDHHEISPYLAARLGLSYELGPLMLSSFLATESEFARLSAQNQQWQLRLGPLIEGKLSLGERIHLTSEWQSGINLLETDTSDSQTIVKQIEMRLNYAFGQYWASSLGWQDTNQKKAGELTIFYYF